MLFCSLHKTSFTITKRLVTVTLLQLITAIAISATAVYCNIQRSKD